MFRHNRSQSPPPGQSGGPIVARPGTPDGEDAAPAPAETILGWLAALLDPDQRVELRAFGVAGRTEARIYPPGQRPELVDHALRLSGRAEGVYFVLNPIGERADGSANDGDIERRLLLLVDCDPTRDPAALEAVGKGGKVSATEGEKQFAVAQAADIRAYLDRLAWPAPAEADSGNGRHLLYRIALPNDEASRDLVKGVLRALAHRFDTADSEVDTVVYNASRVTKFYGTVARKGTATMDRPHRASKILAIPEGFAARAVSREQLETLAALAPPGVSPTASIPAPILRAAGPAPEGRARFAGEDNGKWTPEARAAAYLQKCEPAVSGQKGHSKAFKAACKVGPGFDLHPDTAFRLLWEVYNPTCDPPWSEQELRHKVEDAYAKETRRGWLLNEPPKGRQAPTSTPPPHRGARAGGHGGKADANGDGQAGGPPDGAKPTDDPPDEPPRGLPEIVVSTDEYLVNNLAIAALTADREVFCRGNCLVIVHRDAGSTRLITRPKDTPRIAALARASIRERISKNARWVKWKWNAQAKVLEKVPTHPPDWSSAAIEARGHWEGMRPLEGIVEAPTIRPDGSILDTPGYDESTGLLYEPNCDFPPIPAIISREDAGEAAGLIFELVADFPFAVTRDRRTGADDGGMGHRAAWLAGLLTPLARFSIAGPCPLFLCDGNVSGAGKTLLCDIVAILATGREAARSTYPDSNEEMEKRILSIALEGDRMILLDNLATGAALGGAALDAVLTANTIKGRILGRSEMSRHIPIHTVWYATGNNLGLKGDALRRVVPYRLESAEERPEERDDFRIAGDLRDHVKARRGELVAAALTVLRGYILAGKPEADPKLVAMDYPAWSRMVRQAVHWATGVDPCATRRELVADDPETNALKGLIAGWAELPGGKTGLTTAQAVKHLKNPDWLDRFANLREILMDWSRDGEIPSPRAIGMRLNMVRDKVLDGQSFKSTSQNGTQLWRIAETPGNGTNGTNGTSSTPSREKTVVEHVQCDPCFFHGAAAQGPISPISPIPPNWRTILAGWPDERRERWGQLANVLAGEGFTHPDDEIEAFARVSAEIG